MRADGAVIIPAHPITAVGPTGLVLWEYPLGTWEPVVDRDGTVYAGTLLCCKPLVAIAADGSVKWQRTLELGGSWGVPYPAITSDGGLYITAGTKFYALDRFDGSLRWSVEVPGTIASGITVAPDGTIRFLTDEVRLVALRGDAPLDEGAPWPGWRAGNRRTASVIRTP